MVPLIRPAVGVRKRIRRKHITHDRPRHVPESTQMRILQRARVPVHMTTSSFIESKMMSRTAGRDDADLVELLGDHRRGLRVVVGPLLGFRIHYERRPGVVALVGRDRAFPSSRTYPMRASSWPSSIQSGTLLFASRGRRLRSGRDGFSHSSDSEVRVLFSLNLRSP